MYCDSNPVSLLDPNGLDHHDPMRVYVSHNFEGVVTVVGEPGPGRTDFESVVVPAGHLSSRNMDVDYIMIQHKGDVDIAFLMGSERAGDNVERPQASRVNADGQIIRNDTLPGQISRPWRPTPLDAVLALNWIANFEQGINNPSPLKPKPYPRPKPSKPSPYRDPNPGPGWWEPKGGGSTGRKQV